MCIWKKSQVGSDDGRAGAQSRKSHAHVTAVSPESTVSVATATSNVHLTESESPVSESSSQSISNVNEAQLMNAKIAEWISNSDDV